MFWKISIIEGLLLMLLGFVFYAIETIIMIVAYRFGSLSVLQPMLSLNYVMLIIMTIIDSVVALFLKKASSFNNIKQLLMNINFYLGGILYFISALINIVLLKYINYSVILPLTSITYIWTIIISYLILKEKITIKKVIGVILILIGDVMVEI